MTILLVQKKKKKKGFVCFVSCFVLFVFWFCFCIGCRLSIINQHVNSNEGFSCLASCYKYSPIIHGKFDYYFPINKLRLHNTPNASHSMHTSSVPPHAHIQWSTWCGTSSGPPRAWGCDIRSTGGLLVDHRMWRSPVKVPVLSPCTWPLSVIFFKHDIKFHMYADDIQIFLGLCSYNTWWSCLLFAQIIFMYFWCSKVDAS